MQFRHTPQQIGQARFYTHTLNMGRSISRPERSRSNARYKIVNSGVVTTMPYPASSYLQKHTCCRDLWQ
jgi:hypothetical protein